MSLNVYKNQIKDYIIGQDYQIMKLSEISISNYKSIKNIKLTCNDMIALVGKNNVGKSNIMEAIKLCLEPSPINSSYFWSINNKDEDNKELKIELKFLLESHEKEDFTLYNIKNYLTIQVLEKYQKYDNIKSSTPKQKILSLSPSEEWLNYKKITKTIMNKYKNSELKSCGQNFDTDDDKWEENAKIFFKKLIQNHDYKTYAQSDYVDIKELGDLCDKLPSCIYIPAVKHVTDEIKTIESASLQKLLKLFISSMDVKENEKIEELISNIREKLNSKSTIFSVINSTINESMKEIFSNCTVNISANMLNSLSEFIKNITVIVNDESKEDDIKNKGTGMQRVLIFAILRSYSKKIKNMHKKRSIVFLMEEPEIYLHPHAQRSLYETLIQIKDADQVIYSTHSNLFINIEYYQEICIIRKENGATNVKQYLKSYTEKDFRTKGFKNAFNEGFFADKIILVEGITDEIYLSLFHKYKNLPSLHRKNISLINCEGRESIPHFMTIYEAFNIKCYPIIDSDETISDEFCARFQIDSIPSKSTSYDTGAIFVPKIEMDIFNMHIIEKILSSYLKSRDINKQPKDILKNYCDFYKFVKSYKLLFAIFFSKKVHDETDVIFPPVFEEIFNKLGIMNNSS